MMQILTSRLFKRAQIGLPFPYEGVKPDIGYRIHILVDEMVNVEMKSAKALANVHSMQVLTYLKLSDKKMGLLVNFNTTDISNSIKTDRK